MFPLELGFQYHQFLQNPAEENGVISVQLGKRRLIEADDEEDNSKVSKSFLYE